MRTKKYNVLLIQVNYQYGDNVFIPYSVGTIQAYAETTPAIRDNFRFMEPLFLRKKLSEIKFGSVVPDIVGFSCYIWNWAYNNALAKIIRKAYPNCLILFGGPQVPDRSEGFFFDHPYVDLLVHHEGEYPVSEILMEYLTDKPDYKKIPGLSVRLPNGETFKTMSRGRVTDLDRIPSPYLSGTFDFLLGRGYALSVSQETNRGCPYQCEFCDWGGATYNKLTQFPENRIVQEFEWFGQNKVEYLFNCDSNYGMLPRDMDLAKKMVDIRDKYNGYPSKFRMCTAKKSNEKIFRLTKLLSDAGLSKGATLSFQSMDDHTLEMVKRKNIKITEFSELMAKYHDEGIATYTELIMGMPGETYESTKRGIDMLIDAQEDWVNIFAYVCTMLPNSGLSKPEYVAKHGIKVGRTPILLAHSTPDSREDGVAEYSNIVVGTSTMPPKEWLRTYIFYWAVQCFYCLGLTKHISILFRRRFGLKYSDFYEKLVAHFAGDKGSLIGSQVEYVTGMVEKAIGGGRLDVVIPEFGETCWPFEESSFLFFMKEKDKCYQEIRSFLEALVSEAGIMIDPVLLDDLVSYQGAVIIDPFVGKREAELRYDLHEYFTVQRDRTAPIDRLKVRLRITADRDFAGDMSEYGREVIWYGRKGGKYHHTNIEKEVLC